MQLTFETDEFGRIVCIIADGRSQATVTASNMPEAGTDLIAAMQAAVTTGCGECFWRESAGQYRWLFRREGDRTRMAVIWSSGTVTGWEHVFWGECDLALLLPEVSARIEQLAPVTR